MLLWQQLVSFLQQPAVWYQLVAVAAALTLAWVLNRVLAKRLNDSGGKGLRHVALHSSQRIVLPLAWPHCWR